MRTKLRSRLSLLCMTFALMLAMPAIALADIIVADGDFVTVGNQAGSSTNPIDMGKVKAGGSVDKQVSFQLVCNQKQHVNQGATVTLDSTPDLTGVPTGGSLTATSATIGPIPASWPDDTGDCATPTPQTLEDNGNTTVTFKAPTGATTGTVYNFSVTWSGKDVVVTPTDSSAISGSTPVFFKATVENDSTAPVINSTLNPANADGSNGWYKSNVSLTWSVTDPESAVTKTDCVDQNITTDQQATTYNCSATSAGGSAAQQSVAIKRDATAPTSIQWSGGPDAGSESAFGSVPNAPTCSATDATSGMDSCVVTGHGNAVGGHTMTATATDKAGNKTTATRTYTVNKATAQVNLSDLTQTYNGSPRAATVATVPANLNVDVTYDGNAQVPTNAGSYAVVATVNDNNYQGSASGTLKIEKAAAQVSLSDLTHTYDGVVKAASASTTPSGLNVDFAYSQNGLAATPKNAGSYAVVATVNNANYQGSANGTLSIARADQAISFGALANKTYGDANFNVSASGGASGNPVTFKAVGNCELVGNTVHLTGAGSCTITASQAGNANYNAATDVSRSFAIAKAQASINLSGLSKTYTGQPQAATVTTTPVDLSGVNVTYDGSEQAPTNAGSYNVVASLTNPNYEARNATGTLVIAKAKADVTLSDLTQTYDGTVKAASASTTPSGLNVDFAYSQNGSPATPKNAGSYAVVATVKNANYEGSANGTLVIDKAKASINLSDLSKTYTGQAQGATVTTTPDVPNAQLTVTYDGSEQTPVNAGSYRVVASLNDANYQAQDATGTLVIAKAEATINLGGLSKTYTGQAQGATVTTTPADLGGVSVTYDGIAQAPTNAGSYRVVASLTNPNYEAQNATGTLVIAKAPAQVNLSDLTQTYNGSPRAATVATVPANLNVDVTYDGNAQAPTNAGSYAVVATVKNANYEGSANGTLVIDKASQSITFAPLAAKIVGANFTVNATGGASGNAVTFAAAGSCTVSGNTVQITGVGTCTITASQAGNSNYNAAPNVQQSFSATYNFTGFASPVDNNNVLNTAKAGQAIPLKWRLTDASGNPVTNLSSVKVTATSLNCALGTTTDLLEEYAAGASSLQNLGDGYYQFNWKSPTTYANSCKTLNVDMGEGAAVTHTALFKFTK